MDGPTNADGNRGVIDYSGRLLINDNVRHELSLGNAYRFGIRFLAVGAAAKRHAWFDPSNNGASPNRQYKIKATFQTTGQPILVRFYEDPVLTANGTEVVIYNFNRNEDASLNTYATMYHTPTVDSSGNEYAPEEYIYADTSTPGLSLSTPGDTADEFSAYLNPNKHYLWSFENLGDAATNITISGRIIYEENYRAGGR